MLSMLDGWQEEEWATFEKSYPVPSLWASFSYLHIPCGLVRDLRLKPCIFPEVRLQVRCKIDIVYMIVSILCVNPG